MHLLCTRPMSEGVAFARSDAIVRYGFVMLLKSLRDVLTAAAIVGLVMRARARGERERLAALHLQRAQP